MKVVYIVKMLCSYDHESDYILGVFDSKEKAELYGRQEEMLREDEYIHVIHEYKLNYVHGVEKVADV